MKTCKIWKVLTFSMGLVLVVALSLPSISLAMDKPGGFPDRPITIIVPYGAGGGSDQLTRAMAVASRRSSRFQSLWSISQVEAVWPD